MRNLLKILSLCGAVTVTFANQATARICSLVYDTPKTWGCNDIGNYYALSCSDLPEERGETPNNQTEFLQLIEKIQTDKQVTFKDCSSTSFRARCRLYEPYYTFTTKTCMFASTPSPRE